MKLKFEDKEVELVEIWFKYLYPYLVRFSIKKEIGIEWKNDTIFISDQNRKDFQEMLEFVLEELLNECYVEPTQKERSKHSTRYQKINFKGKVFVLNYRTDIVGILGYALNYLLSESISSSPLTPGFQ